MTNPSEAVRDLFLERKYSRSLLTAEKICTLFEVSVRGMP